MKLNRYCGILFTLILVGIGLASPAFATNVIEGDSSNGWNQSHMNIQIIEGDKVQNNRPPLPPTASQLLSANNLVNDASDLVGLILRFNRQLDPQQAVILSRNIHLLSNNYGLDPRLLTSLVAVESSFRPAAISSSGAIGLGQLKPDTARWLGVADPFDPTQNLIGVAKYLRYLLNRYNGSVEHALAAYFQGQGTVDRNGIDSGALYYIGKVNRVIGNLN